MTFLFKTYFQSLISVSAKLSLYAVSSVWEATKLCLPCGSLRSAVFVSPLELVVSWACGIFETGEQEFLSCKQFQMYKQELKFAVH